MPPHLALDLVWFDEEPSVDLVWFDEQPSVDLVWFDEEPSVYVSEHLFLLPQH
jgi:phage terminase large subunit-like protein